MRLLFATLALSPVFIACGGKDQPAPVETAADASVQTTLDSSSAISEDASSGDAGMDAARIPGFDLDAIPVPDGPLGTCAICIRDMCQAPLAACLMDVGCATGLACAVSKCQSLLGAAEAGTEALLCATSCFPDVQKAFMAASGLTCVTAACGAACGALIDGGVSGAEPTD